jgi:hypothetical protein
MKNTISFDKIRLILEDKFFIVIRYKGLYFRMELQFNKVDIVFDLMISI